MLTTRQLIRSAGSRFRYRARTLPLCLQGLTRMRGEAGMSIRTAPHEEIPSWLYRPPKLIDGPSPTLPGYESFSPSSSHKRHGCISIKPVSVSYPRSTVSCANSCQLSAMSYQRSAFSYELSGTSKGRTADRNDSSLSRFTSLSAIVFELLHKRAEHSPHSQAFSFQLPAFRCC